VLYFVVLCCAVLGWVVLCCTVLSVDGRRGGGRDRGGDREIERERDEAWGDQKKFPQTDDGEMNGRKNFPGMTGRFTGRISLQ
jgi:hypothetical protein